MERGGGEKGNGVNLCQYCPFFPARDGRGSSFRAIVWPRILKALTRSSNRRRLEENKETVVGWPGGVEQGVDGRKSWIESRVYRRR